MKVLISGASGLVGKALQEALKNAGDQVLCLVRNQKDVSTEAVFWNPADGLVDIASLEGFDAFINLAGENIAAGRWGDEQKKRILNSRVESTTTLVNALIRLKQPPKVFINASAIGYYGERGDELLNESSARGAGFLADVCNQWEQAAIPAQEKGIRTVLLRIGVVLSSEGGALAKMLPPFSFGVGGKLGTGEQYMSWIALDDLVGIILYALSHDSIQGPINAVAPLPVTNAAFTAVLGEVLQRPTILTVPAFALKLVAGKELAEEMLLVSTRVEPKKLMDEGYLFKYPNLATALSDIVEQRREKMEKEYGPKSSKSFIATLLFCIFLGTLGIHRFYVGKIGTGILMLLTFGGFGIWWLIDLIFIVSMRFRDKQGFRIEP